MGELFVCLIGSFSGGLMSKAPLSVQALRIGITSGIVGCLLFYANPAVALEDSLDHPASAASGKSQHKKTAGQTFDWSLLGLRFDQVNFSVSGLDRSKLSALKNSSAIHEVILDRTDTSDRDLAIVGTLKSLKCLDLSHTRITSKGLRHLTKLRKLEVLFLTDTSIGDDALGYLAQMHRLKQLSLRGTKVGAESLVQLGSLHSLESLVLTGTPVTDDTLSTLKGLPRLTFLGLCGTRCGDTIAPVLSSFPRLQWVDLEGTAVSDKSIPELAKLTGLTRLDLYHTRMSWEGRLRLARMLKTCSFYEPTPSLQQLSPLTSSNSAGKPLGDSSMNP
jgi:hypothetical protein